VDPAAAHTLKTVEDIMTDGETTVLKQIHEKVGQVLKWQAVHQEGHKTITRDLGEVRTSVYGNEKQGVIGLKLKVDRLWRCKKQLLDWRSFWVGVLKIVTSSAIIGVVVWVLTIYKAS